MYRYDQHDQAIVDQRVEQFRGQVARRLAGELDEDEFKPLRLMNGLYLQLHAYMLRVAIPYGLLSSGQLRMSAHIARRYDKGYGHFTTRQNLQYNWLKLKDVPEILARLATVEMHAIQTSGNCIRNITADHLAGVAADEIEDPRPYCEILRQWSTLHPEFSFLPRKFKIAVTGSPNDRAAVRLHDIGLRMVRNDAGEAGFEVLVGGGMGRTPMIGSVIRDFLPKRHLLSYLEAVMRVYNRHGRRDNIYKARIKILVHSLGAETFRDQVEAEWNEIRDGALALDRAEIDRVAAFFAPPAYAALPAEDPEFAFRLAADREFARWVTNNVIAHKAPGYSIAMVSLKAPGVPPGDATADQMDAVADLAERYGFGTIRVSHGQNLVLPDVKTSALYDLWWELADHGLATANAGTVTDIICCPGLDFCNLATARSIPLAQQIGETFADADRLNDLGEIRINISGCINACAHHHVGHIGILGVDKKGEEFYQITLGGSSRDDAAIGKIIGPAFSKDAIVGAIARLLDAYVEFREPGERFLDTYRRIGIERFKERAYATNH